MVRGLILFISLAFVLLAFASADAQKERRAEPEKSAASPLDGVWEQVEVQVGGRTVAYWPKIVMFNRGAESQWVVHQGRGSLVKPQKLTVGESGVFEFVNQYDNLTVRGLYEFAGAGLLKMCWRDDNKTLIRPERMTPLPEKCAYHLFRRMIFKTDAAAECDKELAGLWYMTAIAEDGKLSEKKDFDYSFEEREIAVYVEGDHLLWLKRQSKEPYLEVTRARLQLRPKAKERAADIKFPERMTQAIYAVVEDRLVICWAKNGKRPDRLFTIEGDERVIYYLKRAAMPK